MWDGEDWSWDQLGPVGFEVPQGALVKLLAHELEIGRSQSSTGLLVSGREESSGPLGFGSLLLPPTQAKGQVYSRTVISWSISHSGKSPLDPKAPQIKNISFLSKETLMSLPQSWTTRDRDANTQSFSQLSFTLSFLSFLFLFFSFFSPLLFFLFFLKCFIF